MPRAGLPTPEEMAEMLQDTAEDRTRIALTVNEATLVLVIMAATEQAGILCEERECESCNETHALFWEISNALPISARVRYQRALREMGIELPPAPWEVVSTR